MKQKNFYKPIGLTVLLLMFVIFLLGAGTKETSVFKFDHSLHVIENEMSCDDCHSGISEKTHETRAMPDHDVCEGCHDIEDDNECGTCHTNPDDPVAIPGIDGLYEGFAHKIHISNELKCDNCHTNVTMPGESPAVPVMSDCQTCHIMANGPLECVQCHTGESPKPDDHEITSWLIDHGLEASNNTSDCSACHEQATCDECHQGENIYGKPHPPTWQFNHFTESAFGGECLVCHETRDECTSCHRSILPTPHGFGPVWAHPDNGGDHVEEAKSFMETCIACHDIGEDDPTCARCHDE
ncbi:MAG: cytochrome c3 family protein [Candidatus Electryonea clarkiae]|nr:cytochrome c3 family protein [Candidatus Electryonea clarkiae]